MQAKHLRHLTPPEDLVRIAWAEPGTVEPVDPNGVDVTIFTVPTSICSQRVRLTLEEKGVPYSDHSMNMVEFENLQPWYLALNPRGLVPTLKFGERAIFDSLTVMLFIDNHFAGPRLRPTDPAGREAMAGWLKRFDDFPVHYLSYRWQLERIKQGAPDYWTPNMHGNVLRAMERFPEQRELYERKLVEWDDIVRHVDDPAHMAEVERRAQELADDIDAAVSAHSFLVGDGFTLADITAVATLVRLQCGCGLHLWGDGLRPRLEDYAERLKRRPSYRPGLLDPYDLSKVFALQGDCWFPARREPAASGREALADA